MATITDISDAGGVTRKAKKIFASDASAVVRKIKKVFVSDPGAEVRLVFTSNIFTLTSGAGGGSSGYTNGGFGTLAPSNVLSDGNVIQELASSNTIPHPMIVNITGSGISAGYLTDIIINGNTFLGSSSSFSGSSSNGVWTWASGQLLNAGPYTVEFDVT
jgi:hypothetical protein